MYLINQSENKLEKVHQKTFSELGFKERDNLQEWVANNPECLGEDLLIIQKEFNGFNDTNERLDLLALDKQGNVVVIENKLDDSGKDVTWQVLKYASYCSSLTKSQLTDIYQQYLLKQGKSEDAKENISDFINNIEYSEIKLNQGTSQRIIMIAGNYRKEVTSTVLWLSSYKLRIQCFKATPYSHADNLFLDIEQIIPIKDIEQYSISMADKSQEANEIQENSKKNDSLRFRFWSTYLKELSKGSDVYKNISPGNGSWIGTGSGYSGLAYNSVITYSYARIELYISRSSKEENKEIFDFLYGKKDDIEKAFGNVLLWERLDSKKACRIKSEMPDVDYTDEGDWEKIIAFFADRLPKFVTAFSEGIKYFSKHR